MRRLSRQQQAPLSLGSLNIKTKPQPSFRNNNSTTQVRNPQIDILKLPALNTMRKSTSNSTGERNTKFKLQALDEKLQEFAVDVHNSRLDAQETIAQVRYLKESLANKEIERIRDDLKKQAKGLERLVHASIASDQQRTKMVKENCRDLWQQTQNLRSMLFQIRIRADNLQQSLGFKAN